MQDIATPNLKTFARGLLASQAASGKPDDAKGSAAFYACQKLGEPLGQILGLGGFRALLSRAVALAGADVPWLRGLHIKADGSLEGVDELEAKLDSSAVAEGEVVLLAELLGLLVIFIGPALTLRVLQSIWPNMDDQSF